MSNMETAKTASLSLSLPAYSQLICNYDERNAALWYYTNPQPRPCFSPILLKEIRDLQKRLREHLLSPSPQAAPIHYLVKASAVPGVFNLGGDLKLFVDKITKRDRDALCEYGKLCIDLVFDSATNLGIPSLTTISLVQGSALGGGLEAALAQNVVIAEESAQMGFPEILFNLFPGMGAYSLLARRIGARRTERLLRSGAQYSGRELGDFGAVDAVSKDGDGVRAVNDFIRAHSRARNGNQAIQQVAQRVNPLSYEELHDVVEIWVEAALRLTSRDLRMMQKLVKAQERRAGLGFEETATASSHVPSTDRASVVAQAENTRRLASAVH